MRIGYFSNYFPYVNPVTGDEIIFSRYGGVDNVVFNLTVEMAKRGHEVYVFTSSNNSTNYIEDYGNIRIYRYKKNFSIGLAPISLGVLYKPLFSNLNLDILHAHIGNLPAPLTAFIYSKLNRKPVITTYHEDWMSGFGSIPRRLCVFLFDHVISDRLLDSSSIVLTPSEYYIEKSKHLNRIKHKVIAIPNGINLEGFDRKLCKEECRKITNLPLNKKIILFVGSLTPRKAPHILLQSMKRILREEPNTHLVLIGSGNFSSELKSLAKDLEIEQNVTFTGFIDDKIKTLYYFSSDIFVLPSFSEGFGIVLLEASACGLPLVVSNLEVFNTIVKDSYNGLYTETGNEVDLAEKIIYLLQNNSLRLKMGDNSKSVASNFSWEKVTEETEKVYIDILKKCS